MIHSVGEFGPDGQNVLTIRSGMFWDVLGCSSTRSRTWVGEDCAGSATEGRGCDKEDCP